MAKRIIVVDDHDVVRKGVRLILRGRSEWQVIAEAVDGMDALEKIKSLSPDLVVLDITMPGKGGLDVMRDLNAMNIQCRVLVLTMHDSQELIATVREAGASGYVVKTSAGRDLIRAVETIFADGVFFPIAGADFASGR